jgi:O-succinylbenzoic acid--CoA ligase
MQNLGLPFSLKKIFAKYAYDPAILIPGKIITYIQLQKLVCYAADQLRNQGVRENQKVAIFATNNLEYVIILMAIWQMGGVAVLLNIRWPDEYILKQLLKIKCQILILKKPDDQKFKSNKMQILKFRNIVNISIKGISKLVNSIKDWELKKESTVIFTSGSTGDAKAVVHTFSNHFYSALGSKENISFGRGDTWWINLPLYHVGGLAILFRALLSGGAVALTPVERFVSDSSINNNVTHISLVTTQLQRLIENQEGIMPLQRMKAVLLGGAMIQDRLVKQVYELNIPIYTSYGSTEMASQITTTPPNCDLKTLLTSGKILPYREIKINKDGEILVKGLTLFKGYLEGLSLHLPLDEQGWYHTGDLGKIDHKGNLLVMGRLDNMFISGGENIYPEEIERAMLQNKYVNEVVVVPVFDLEFGQIPFAFIKMKQNKKLDVDQIKKTLSRFLPAYKFPQFFYLWPKSFQSSGLKVDRKKFIVEAEDIIKKVKVTSIKGE